MPARSLDGKRIAAELLAELRPQADALAAVGPRPKLVAVLVGADPASQVYVRNKARACAAAGVLSELRTLPAEAGEAALAALVAELNSDPAFHGILVQLPLPRGWDESAAIRAIDPRKDVDCFHPENLGRLFAGDPRFLPCTPAGVLEILRRESISTAGRHAVVVGRSNIVGKPLALMLAAKGVDATVTLCHSRTIGVAAFVRSADLVVAAAGQPGLIQASMLKPGATVIDVGTNRLPDGRLVGDVDFAAAAEVAGAITPVPGGVGPMTCAMLVGNTLRAAAALSKPAKS
jgi:methylenetetrahydrofolate dehydrogenase (NADP+) / methenyltetrahydrofolate cyclohydrolase